MMSTRDYIRDELLEISPVIATISRSNVYSVPLNYFDGLAGNILRLIRDDIAGTTLPASPAPFTVPNGYFNTLADEVLGKIRQQGTGQNEVYQELAEVAPLLNTISKALPYSVPVGYFEELKVNAPQVQNAPAKVRSITGLSRVFRYAVAAAVTGVLAVGTYFFTAKDDKVNDGPVVSTLNIPAAVDRLSDSEIMDYLNADSFGSDAASVSNNYDEEVDINEVIKNMSDDEIRRYLEDNGTPEKKKAKDS